MDSRQSMAGNTAHIRCALDLQTANKTICSLASVTTLTMTDLNRPGKAWVMCHHTCGVCVDEVVTCRIDSHVELNACMLPSDWRLTRSSRNGDCESRPADLDHEEAVGASPSKPTDNQEDAWTSTITCCIDIYVS